MWQYNYTPSTDVIMHYGVLGMRWGHRKAKIPSVSQKSTNNAVDKAIDAKVKMKSAKKAYKSANRKFNKAYRNSNSWILNSQFDKEDNKRRKDKMMEAGQKAEAAKKAYKKAKENYKLSNKRAKTAVKDIKKQYRKQYMAGESFIGKMYAKYTDADRIYADLQYEFNRNQK